MALFDEMVSSYNPTTKTERENATHEVMQRVALSGLARGGFFDRAAFYGGTCLHLFYGMKRFSENMDFSLMAPDPTFTFEQYFPIIKETFALTGKEIEISRKEKGVPTDIESAFLKESSDIYRIGFTTEKQIKVKIEVDINPPPKFKTEQKLLMKPNACWVRTFDLPGLYAGKVSAALFRQWKRRVKGRDWYDIAWYVAQGAAVDIEHLVERGRDSFPEVDLSTPEAIIAAFDKRIDEIDFAAARADVIPFIENPAELDIWSREYFHALVRQMKFV